MENLKCVFSHHDSLSICKTIDVDDSRVLIQEEFLLQMERLKDAFSAEREELEKRIVMLQDEIEDINRTREKEDRCAV